MRDLELFLGFCPDTHFNEAQSEINPHLLKLLKSGGNYLQEIVLDGRVFLGKKTEIPLSLENLKLLEANVLSLLKKLAPQYPYPSNPLVLLTLGNAF